jgi:GDPmannose 4,6-dehydratase
MRIPMSTPFSSEMKGKRKVLLFGANGQDGHYLTQYLESMDIQVVGVSRSGEFLRTRLNVFEEVSALIKQLQPDYIIHLAANSTTRHDAMMENHETISTGTLHLLEATRLHAPRTKVFISGSGLQFQNNGNPIRETDPFEARDAYSVSRIQSVYAARYFRTLGVQTYVGYFFNHDSPRRSERHMAQKIAAAARRIARGSDETLVVGDPSVVKEWTYAGDVVKAIWLLMNQSEVFEANLGSGLGYSIQDWIGRCFAIAGKDPAKYIHVDDTFKAEYKSLVSDASLIQQLGFKPTVEFDELAKMMMRDA